MIATYLIADIVLLLLCALSAITLPRPVTHPPHQAGAEVARHRRSFSWADWIRSLPGGRLRWSYSRSKGGTAQALSGYVTQELVVYSGGGSLGRSGRRSIGRSLMTATEW